MDDIAALTCPTPYGPVPAELMRRVGKIRLLLSDVDGVLSDGRIYLSNSGEEIKNFNAKDGFGIVAVQKRGVDFGVITGRKSAIVENRLKSLGARYIRQGAEDKTAVLAEIMNAAGLAREEVAYIGDDVIDVTVFARCGLAFCPADAHPTVRAIADYVCRLRGGDGAVREVCDLILAARGALGAVGASV